MTRPFSHCDGYRVSWASVWFVPLGWVILAAPGFARPPADRPQEPPTEYFRQLEQNPHTEAYLPLGILKLVRAESGWKLIYLDYTYHGRTVILPKRIERLQRTETTLSFDAHFTLDDETELIGQFRLAKEAQRWQGHIQIEHEKLANGRLRTAVRLEPLNGPSALRQELAAVVERLNVEKAVSEGLIPGYRQNLKQWEDRLAMDRRLGRPTTGTPTALQTTAAATFLNLEESRVGRLEAMIAQATEARIRAEHSERSAP